MVDRDSSFTDAEKIESLFSGLESLVNEDAPRLLANSPIELQISGLHAATPRYVVPAEVEFRKHHIDQGEYTGSDISICLKGDEDPELRSLTLNWSGGASVICRPHLHNQVLALFQMRERTVVHEVFTARDIDEIWRYFGIADDLLSATTGNIGDILDGLHSQYSGIEIARERTIAIDPFSAIALRFHSHLRRTCVIDRQSLGSTYDVANEYSATVRRWGGDSTQPKFQNEIVFHPDNAGRFRYDGTWNSHIIAGQLLGETQVDRTQRTSMPDINLLAQIVETLTEVSHSESSR